jgi:hypothetical protein
MEKKMKTKAVTRALILAPLMLNLGVAAVYAQEKHVKMSFSGTLEVSAISLQPDTNTDGENVAGDGTLGPFTFRELHADVAVPQASSTCSGPTRIYFPTVSGGGVFRFQDGSLLTVNIMDGAICIDFAAGMARLTETYQITGGTRRLKGASGTLTMTATLTPALFNSSNSVVLATNTGKFEGTIFGVDIDKEDRDDR